MTSRKPPPPPPSPPPDDRKRRTSKRSGSDDHPATPAQPPEASCGGPVLRLAGAEDQITESDVPTVLETIRGLHAKSISGQNLSALDRRAVVEHLSADGLTVAQIAEILKVSERTIKRDRKVILQLNAIEADPELVPQMCGRLIGEAELAISRIRSAARDKEADPAVRIDAEHRCFQIINDMVHRLQRLGYLPTAAQRLEASVLHQPDDLPTSGDLHLQLQHLRMVAQSDGAAIARLNELEASLTRIDVFEGLAQVSGQLELAEGGNGTPN